MNENRAAQWGTEIVSQCVQGIKSGLFHQKFWPEATTDEDRHYIRPYYLTDQSELRIKQHCDLTKLLFL